MVNDYISPWDSFFPSLIFSTNLFIYFIPELLLLSYLLLSLIFLVVFFSQQSKYFLSKVKLKYVLKNITVNITVRLFKFLFVIILLYGYIFAMTIEETFIFNNLLIIDSFSVFTKLFLSSVFMVVLFFCFQFVLFESLGSLELPILFGFSLFFSIVLLSSVDFFLMYLMVEALTFIVCILIATNYSSSFSLESAIKYFIVSSLASGFIIYGIFWIYAITKGTSFIGFKTFCLYNSNNTNLIISLKLPILLMVLGFLIKLGSFPFSIWTPDVYEGSPVFVVFYFIVGLKTVFIFIFTRILFFVFSEFHFYWHWFLIVAAVGSFLFGGFGAYSQKNLKRFFAYTSLNQLGFILLGLSSYSFELAVSSTLFFLVTYVINNILFFSIFLCFYNSNSYRPITLLADLKGLSYFYPWQAIGLTIALFSFIGLPPLAGFFSKFFILLSASKSNFFFCIIIALFSNGVSAFYYIKILKLIWFEPFEKLKLKSFFFKSFLNRKIVLVLLLCAIFNCFFFLSSGFFLNFFNLIGTSCFIPTFH